MRQAAKWLCSFCLPTILATMLLSACENDLKKVREISAKELNNPVDSSVGVEVIYSDSARVKAKMETPLLLDFTNTGKPYHEMPKGIKITFYDKDLKPSGTVVSRYAITSNNDRVITLTKNVVLTNTAGDTFKSEEMIWDQNRALLFTDKAWEWHKMDGTDLHGTEFQTNEKFSPWSSTGGNGVIETHGAIKP